jgi:hypothetical protein
VRGAQGVRVPTVLALQASVWKSSAFALCPAHTTQMLSGEKHYAEDIEPKVDTKTPAL